MAHKPSKRKSAGAKARPGLPVSAPNLPRSLSKVNLNAAGIECYAKQYRQRVVKNLERRAAQLQLCLIPIAKTRTELAG